MDYETAFGQKGKAVESGNLRRRLEVAGYEMLMGRKIFRVGFEVGADGEEEGEGEVLTPPGSPVYEEIEKEMIGIDCGSGRCAEELDICEAKLNNGAKSPTVSGAGAVVEEAASDDGSATFVDHVPFGDEELFRLTSEEEDEAESLLTL